MTKQQPRCLSRNSRAESRENVAKVTMLPPEVLGRAWQGAEIAKTQREPRLQIREAGRRWEREAKWSSTKLRVALRSVNVI